MIDRMVDWEWNKPVMKIVIVLWTSTARPTIADGLGGCYIFGRQYSTLSKACRYTIPSTAFSRTGTLRCRYRTRERIQPELFCRMSDLDTAVSLCLLIILPNSPMKHILEAWNTPSLLDGPNLAFPLSYEVLI